MFSFLKVLDNGTQTQNNDRVTRKDNPTFKKMFISLSGFRIHAFPGKTGKTCRNMSTTSPTIPERSSLWLLSFPIEEQKIVTTVYNMHDLSLKTDD